jgi:hypothetical protein
MNQLYLKQRMTSILFSPEEQVATAVTADASDDEGVWENMATVSETKKRSNSSSAGKAKKVKSK